MKRIMYVILTVLAVGIMAASVSAGGGKPDLIIDKTFAEESWFVETTTFAADSCEVQDGDISSPGEHKLLYFSTETANIGKVDLVIGSPPPVGSPDTSVWQWSNCHGHWHFLNYASYRLLDAAGNEVGRGHKQAFCIEDVIQYKYDQRTSTEPLYNCDNQGIEHGWADIYGSGLSGQWVEVDGVSSGTYTLEMVINPARVIVESRYKNNTIRFPVTIP